MKRFLAVCLIFLSSMLFGSTYPWDLDPETYEALNAQIEQKHKERVSECVYQREKYLSVDRIIARLNFSKKNCPCCETFDDGKEFEAILKEAGFQKKDRKEYSLHCFGVTFVFVKHLLSHPQAILGSYKQILSEISSDPDFKRQAHVFSYNQFNQYQVHHRHDTDLPDYKFLEILMGQAPETIYFCDPSKEDLVELDRVGIYATLQKMPNKVVFVGYEDKYGPHTVAFSTHAEKLLFFDSNEGLFQFPNLETLSWYCEKAMEGCKFHWLASFALPTQDVY